MVLNICGTVGLKDSAAPACHKSQAPALPACEKRDLSTRNPFSWVRPFPSSKHLNHQFFFQPTHHHPPHITHHTTTSLSILPPICPLDTYPQASATRLSGRGVQSPLRASALALKVAPSAASTLHEHPVVSCEPVIHRLSAFTATLFFDLVIPSEPTTVS